MGADIEKEKKEIHIMRQLDTTPFEEDCPICNGVKIVNANIADLSLLSIEDLRQALSKCRMRIKEESK